MSNHDVIVIGGSYAGLTAAMQLSRARRSVLLIDGGQRRNRFASHAHGFLGQDGVPPGDIAAKGRAEVLAYPTARWLDDTVLDARADGNGFLVRSATGEHRARRIILATGVSDHLPPVPGLLERWGASVFHCPYCHGFELERRPLGVLAWPDASAAHFALVVSEWSERGGTRLFTNGGPGPEPDLRALVERRGIVVERAPVRAIEDADGGARVVLDGGATHDVAGLFAVSRSRVPTLFTETLGCAVEVGPAGGTFYKTDATRETNVRNVFACGDAALPMGSVSFAVGDGMLAGTATHRSLIFRED